MSAPMRRVSRRNLAAHKVRLVLTVVSVVLGTAFIAGSFVFTDTLKGTFDKIFASSYQGVDVQVQARSDRSAGVPDSLVPTLTNLPGVRAVQVQASAPVVLIGANGKKVDTGGAPSEGSIWYPPNERLDKTPTFQAGGPPGPGQVVINAGAAKKSHLTVGAHTRVLTTTAGMLDVTISGIYHTDTQTGGYVGVLFPEQQALKLFTDGSHVDSVSLGAAGVDEQTLRDRVARVLPGDLEAKTGDQVRADTKTSIENGLSFVNYFLLAFGFIALLVGTFIIYNTFSMIVAQRTRELALLRAIGADRAQVRRAVLFEAGIIGLIGSVIGMAAGVGLAYGLRAFLDAINTGLPGGALVLQPRTIIIAVLVGTLVTILSANAPARRAATTPPVAAMRSEFAALGVSLRRRSLIGALVTAAGAVVTGLGALSQHAGTGASLIGLGLLGVGAGVLLLSPVLSRIVIGPLGRLVGRPFGAAGRLARTNAVRNPRRTAATAFALTMGLLLVSAIAVIGASAKKSVDKAVDNGVTADYILTTQADLPIPLQAADAARKVHGIGSFVELHDLQTTVDGKNTDGAAVDGTLADVAPLKITAGSGRIGPGDLLVSQKTATGKHWTLAAHVVMRQPGGSSATLTVTGVYADSQLFGSWVTGGDVYRQLTPASRWADIVVLVRAAPHADLAAMRAGLNDATDPYYVVNVQDREQYKGSLANQIDGLLAILYGLLGLAIVIAILGIVNTLALSVVERRQEIGMLRAVGMLRRQVRRAVYVESFLIAMFGAALGLGLGLTFGALFTRTLRSAGLGELSIPWGQAVLFLVVAGAVGVLAALWPAARAARTKPLEAIAEA